MTPILYTDSSKPEAHFIRETAICLLACETLLGHDSATVENAVAWARAFMDNNENAVHDGDCTNAAMTCSRCLVDDALEEAQIQHGVWPPETKEG